MARSVVAVLDSVARARAAGLNLMFEKGLLSNQCLYTLHDTLAKPFEHVHLYSVVSTLEALYAMKYKQHLADCGLRPGAKVGPGAELPINLATGPV